MGEGVLAAKTIGSRPQLGCGRSAICSAGAASGLVLRRMWSAAMVGMAAKELQLPRDNLHGAGCALATTGAAVQARRKTDCVRLAFRYPGDAEQPSVEEAQAALAVVREVYETLLAYIPGVTEKGVVTRKP